MSMSDTVLTRKGHTDETLINDDVLLTETSDHKNLIGVVLGNNDKQHSACRDLSVRSLISISLSWIHSLSFSEGIPAHHSCKHK